MSPAEPLRFAIVGAGVIGKHHAKVIASLDDVILVGVVDVDEARADALAARNDARSATTFDELLRVRTIDAVAICTPSGQHADGAVAALDAGCHVLIEKPIDISLGAADRIVDAQRRSGRQVGVVSQHRFDESSRLVHDAVTAGRFGTITSGVATVSWWRSAGYYASAGWRGTWAQDGGGALMNQGIHTLDLLLWMLGEPVEVMAHAATLAHDAIEVEDVAAAVLRFAGGAVATLLTTTAAHPGLSARLQIHGDRGSAVIDDDLLTYFHAADANAAATSAYGASGGGGNQAAATAAPHTAGADPANLSDAHALQYRDFVDAIRHDRAPLVTPEDGRRTLAAVLAVYESARTGRPVAPG